MRVKNIREISLACNTLYQCFIRYTEQILEMAMRENIDTTTLKKSFLEHIVELYKSKCSDITKSNVEYLEEVKRGLLSAGYAVIELDAKLESIALVSVSSGLLQGVFEVGLSWDYVRDTPYIPASSIKGAIRDTLLMIAMLSPGGLDSKVERLFSVFELLGCTEATSLEEIKELVTKLKQEKQLEELKRELQLRFRKHSKDTFVTSGLLIFIDAYPVECPPDGLLRGWVISPHYREAKDEYDAQPIPILHVVLNEGVMFRFLVGVPPEAVPHIMDVLGPILGVNSTKVNDIEQACTLLTTVMKLTLRNGIGARTSKGYGRFEIHSAKIYTA